MTRLYFREMGAGPVLVFVHGLGVSSRYFVPLMTALSAGFRCIAPDLPGSGRSRAPERPLDVPGLADALADFLDGLDVDDVTLIANSLGCQVVAALAERDPNRGAPLILLAPTLDPSTRHRFWRTLFLAAVREPVSLLPIVLWDYLRFGLPTLIATIRYALADDLARRLPRLLAPTLVIQGGRDCIVTLPWATEVARRLPRGRLVVLPDGAHAVHYSRPTEVAGLIRAFLAEAGRPSIGSGETSPQSH